MFGDVDGQGKALADHPVDELDSIGSQCVLPFAPRPMHLTRPACDQYGFQGRRVQLFAVGA